MASSPQTNYHIPTLNRTDNIFRILTCAILGVAGCAAVARREIYHANYDPNRTETIDEAQYEAHARSVWKLPGPSDPDQRNEDHLRILFIGNSYTEFWGGQPFILAAMMKDRNPIFDYETHVNWNLANMLEESSAPQRIAERSPLRPEALTWDYVVLQDHSENPVHGEQIMIESIVKLDAMIRSAGAKTILFETWCHKTQPETQKIISRVYHETADLLNSLPENKSAGRVAIVVPAGEAFERVSRLHPEIDLYYKNDIGHPSPAGSYLAACVFYSVLTGKSPVGQTATINEWIDGSAVNFLDPAHAAILQQAAWDTVKGNP